MVSFFGYDAPPGLIEASSTTLANEGAPKLAGFLNGIYAAREHGALAMLISPSPVTPTAQPRQESPQLWWEMASSTTWFNSARLARAFRTWVSSMSPKDTRTSAPHAHRFLEDP